MFFSFIWFCFVYFLVIVAVVDDDVVVVDDDVVVVVVVVFVVVDWKSKFVSGGKCFALQSCLNVSSAGTIGFIPVDANVIL